MTREEKYKQIELKLRKDFYEENKDKSYWQKTTKQSKIDAALYRERNREKLKERRKRTIGYNSMERKIKKLGYIIKSEKIPGKRMRIKTILDDVGDIIMKLPSIYLTDDFEALIQEIFDKVNEDIKMKEYSKYLGF